MSVWRQITRGLRSLTQRTATDREIDDEVQHYLEQATADGVTRGLAPEEARRAARIELGSPTAVREQMRDYGWENAIGTFFADLRYAARRLRNNPGSTAVAILTLALGIGASTAIFSAVNPILFEPLPYPHASRITMVWDTNQGNRVDVTFHTYREVAARARSLDSVAVMKPWQPTMTSATQPERFDGQHVTWRFFRVLGVLPALGRDFEESEDRFRGPRVMILSDSLWRRRFAADPGILGKAVKLDDSLYTIIGVMPRGFENVLAPSAELWSPLQYNEGNITTANSREWGHHLRMIARARPGVALEGVRRELETIARVPVQEFPRPRWASLQAGFLADSLQDGITRGIKPALLAVLGAVILVLLIAVVNVTNLLLARGAQRSGEFAMRAALGAGRSRMLRQLLTESLLLAILGGAVGMIVASFGVQALVALSPARLPRAGAIRVDGTVFAFAFAVTTLIGLAVGLIPALHASRVDLQNGMQQNSRRTSGGRNWTRQSLVIVEVGLALVLLVGAGLLLRSLQRLFSIAPGFDPARLLSMQVHVSGRRFDDDAATLRFFAQALEAVRQTPGVTQAAFTSLLPLSGDSLGQFGIQFQGEENRETVFRYVVSPGFCETMGIPLLRGRQLDARDVAGAPLAVVISESLARAKFPGKDPIGQRLRAGPPNRAWSSVVGVVGDVRQASLVESDPNAVYLTPEQSWFADTEMSLVVRGRGDVSALVPAIKSAIWSVDKDQPIVRVAMMDALLTATASERRFAMIVFEAFALVALLLAATGLYGVLSGSVTERTREIGVRAALGASRADILGLVVRQGMTLTGVGVAIGLGGAVLASRALITLLFSVSRLDLATYAGVVGLLLAVSALACWVPAWRAARVDPATTLRAE